jgi:hypothetical protein
MAFTVNEGKNAIFGVFSIFILLGLAIGAVSVANREFVEVAGETSNASLAINQTQAGLYNLAANQVSLAGIVILFILVVVGMMAYGMWQQRR